MIFKRASMKSVLLILTVLIVAGCSSEVDKCVDSYLTAREIKIEREKKALAEWEIEMEERKNKIEKDPLDKLLLGGFVGKPIVSSETKEEAAARFRYACLNAAGKK